MHIITTFNYYTSIKIFKGIGEYFFTFESKYLQIKVTIKFYLNETEFIKSNDTTFIINISYLCTHLSTKCQRFLKFLNPHLLVKKIIQNKIKLIFSFLELLNIIAGSK